MPLPDALARAFGRAYVQCLNGVDQDEHVGFNGELIELTSVGRWIGGATA